MNPTSTKPPKCPRLSRGINDVVDGQTSRLADLVGNRQSAADAVRKAVGPDWAVRSVVRDPCIGVWAANSDMWVLILERISASRPTWAAVLLHNSDEHSRNGSRFSPAWEAAGKHARTDAVQRALSTALTAPSPTILLERFSRGDRYWPTMRAAEGRRLDLHDPALATCRALLRLQGVEGEALRLSVALGEPFPAVSGDEVGHALIARIETRAIYESIRVHGEALRNRLAQWAPNGVTWAPPARIDDAMTEGDDEIHSNFFLMQFGQVLAQAGSVPWHGLDQWGVAPAAPFMAFFNCWLERIDAEGTFMRRSGLRSTPSATAGA